MKIQEFVEDIGTMTNHVLSAEKFAPAEVIGVLLMQASAVAIASSRDDKATREALRQVLDRAITDAIEGRTQANAEAKRGA